MAAHEQHLTAEHNFIRLKLGFVVDDLLVGITIPWSVQRLWITEVDLVLSCVPFLFKCYYDGDVSCSLAFNKSQIDIEVHFVA